MARTLKAPQQIAHDYIREEIFAGRFPGGMRLKSDVIARAIGVSRMPVRDALRQLEAEGLVSMQPNRGATVTNLTPDDVLELFEMRAVLEGLAAFYAARNVTREAIESLEFDLEKMARLKSNYIAWIEAHDVFHDNVCALSKRPQLVEQIKMIRQQVRPYTRFYGSIFSNQPEVVGHEHSLILESLSRSPEVAESVMRAHVVANGINIVQTLQQSSAEKVPAVAK